MFEIAAAGDLFESQGGFIGRLGGEIPHRSFQSVDEAFQVMPQFIINGAVNRLQLRRKVVQE